MQKILHWKFRKNVKNYLINFIINLNLKVYLISILQKHYNYIDASNLKGEDYEQLLEDLGAKNENKQVIKVETIKK